MITLVKMVDQVVQGEMEVTPGAASREGEESQHG